MRTTTWHSALLLLLVSGGACAPSATPAGTTTSATPATPVAAPNPPASSSSEAGGLAAIFGRGGALMPEGLVAGGDCPPAPPDAAQEMAAQAQASVPLVEGLTFAYAWTRTPKEEYECLIQVTKIDAGGVDTTLSCDAASPDGSGRHLRRVCRTDLRQARMLHTVYGVVKVIGASGEPEPETVIGATAFSLSSAQFAELKRTGAFTKHYVELGSSGQLAKNGVGELRTERKDTMSVVVNDRLVDIPVVRVRGTVSWWIRGQRLDTESAAVILDDERFPLLIDQQDSAETTGSRIRFTKITYPARAGTASGGGGGSLAVSGALEGGLADNKRVDVYGIYFDFNSDRIRPESEPVLREIGDIMRRHVDWRLAIDGHTDNIGGDSAANLDLSRRRSESVRRALVSRFGVAADRLVTGGYGASSPKATNDTPEGRARNRRVELSRR